MSQVERKVTAGAAQRLFSFPNPVNEVAARCVAGGVVLMVAVALTARLPLMLVPLVYGFWARLLTGPTLSPLGQLATRVVVPALHVAPRPVPGPPKRFAQGIGAVMSTAAALVWATAGWGDAAWLVALLGVAAFLESAFGLCLGCKVFAALMKFGVIPSHVCEECADLTRRLPGLAERSSTST